MLDGDEHGLDGRFRQLKRACMDRNIDAVRIETWLADLAGDNVDKTKDDFPRLRRARDCEMHAGKLSEMCQRKQLREPAPPSLIAACEE